MGGEAAKLAQQREREAYEKTQAAQLPPTDPIRRAKLLDGVPAPADVGAPNGTAGKAEGPAADQSGAVSDPNATGPETPKHMPEVQPTVAQDSRPAKAEGAPGLPSDQAEAAAVAQPDAKPALTKPVAKKPAAKGSAKK